MYTIDNIIEVLGEKEVLNALVQYLPKDTVDEFMESAVSDYDLDYHYPDIFGDGEETDDTEDEEDDDFPDYDEDEEDDTNYPPYLEDADINESDDYFGEGEDEL